MFRYIAFKLGTTLNSGGKSVNITALGESTDTNVMYTGKPYIGELGYAFLFRNYRSDLGKWQTTDPLGYPDGWNNLSYCNNGVIFAIDLFGCNVYELLDREGAGNNGHSLPIATKQNADGTWTSTGYDYGAGFSSGSSGNKVSVKSFTGSSQQEVLNKIIDYYDPKGKIYDAMYEWSVNNQNSQKAMDAMANEVKLPYHARTHNCLDITKSGLEAVGVYCEDSEWRPNQAKEMRSNATDVTSKLKKFQE